MNSFKVPCSCGQESKYCISTIYVSDNGVLSTDSSKLLMCGKVKKQLEAIKRLKINEK